jgi:glycosyltransferase involved in cell wall biosynthesis
MKYPKVSFLIPTYNEEDNLEDCLKSIFKQDYPKDKLEVFVIDNESTDHTLEIAKRYPVKILINKKKKDAQVSTRMAYGKSSGEFYSTIGADQRLADKFWLKRMVAPLINDPEITASYSSMKIKGDESPLTKFLTLDWYSPKRFSCQLTPMYQFFTTSVTDTYIEKKKGYFICKFEEGKIPPLGFGILRKSTIDKTLHLQGDKLMELDILVHLVRMGYQKFAYVPIGTYHYLFPDLKTVYRKRFRNISRNYVGQDFKRSYTWFNLKSPRDLFKIFFWIIYATLIIPELIRGIYKSIRYKTWVGMYQPLVSFTETYVVILGFAYFYLMKFLNGKKYKPV